MDWRRTGILWIGDWFGTHAWFHVIRACWLARLLAIGRAGDGHKASRSRSISWFSEKLPPNSCPVITPKLPVPFEIRRVKL